MLYVLVKLFLLSLHFMVFLLEFDIFKFQLIEGLIKYSLIISISYFVST